ncbi:hypothetical protein, partial [Streptomyces formicae]
MASHDDDEAVGPRRRTMLRFSAGMAGLAGLSSGMHGTAAQALSSSGGTTDGGRGQLRAHLAALHQVAKDHGGNRASGQPGYEASAAYVEKILARTPLRVDRQYFDYGVPVVKRRVLEQKTPSQRSFDTAPVYGVAPSPAGGYTGKLIVPHDSFGDSHESWAELDTDGKVALLRLKPLASRDFGYKGMCHTEKGSARDAGLEYLRRVLAIASEVGIHSVLIEPHGGPPDSVPMF